LHWILDKSQIGGSSHPGDGSQGQWSTAASSPGPSWMLDDKGFVLSGLLSVLHRSDRCLLAVERVAM
jgi:hypothetical protein